MALAAVRLACKVDALLLLPLPPLPPLPGGGGGGGGAEPDCWGALALLDSVQRHTRI